MVPHYIKDPTSHCYSTHEALCLITVFSSQLTKTIFTAKPSKLHQLGFSGNRLEHGQSTEAESVRLGILGNSNQT